MAGETNVCGYMRARGGSRVQSLTQNELDYDTNCDARKETVERSKSRVDFVVLVKTYREERKVMV